LPVPRDTSTAKAGRSWLTLPKPYATHAPMLGRPASCEPVCTKVIAGSWLIASVRIDLMTHSSSATLAVCGNSSLSQVPERPWRSKRKIDGATGRRFWPEVMVVMRWPMRTDVGSSMPRLSANSGLWSNRSICDGAPDWNR
jgi:hypothetical protein